MNKLSTPEAEVDPLFSGVKTNQTLAEDTFQPPTD
jgi:hypothetical protein